MVNAKIATSAEQPINSDGAVANETFGEGDLVSLNASGELVAADAASGLPAVGVAATPVDDPSTYPDGQFEYAAKVAESSRAQINDTKVGYVKHGVEVVNNDGDCGFTPGEPVYLGDGGDYVQSKPADGGDVVQAVGSAGPDGESVFLNVQPDYTTA